MSIANKIDHIAIVVNDLDEAGQGLGEVLDLVESGRESVASQRTEAAFFPVGDTNIELIRPQGNESLQRYLDKRGPGLHHIAVQVDDLKATLAELKRRKVRLIDEEPRSGSRGHLVAFVHPKSTGGVLVELVEHQSD